MSDRLTQFVEHRTTTSELRVRALAQTLFYKSNPVPRVFLTKREGERGFICGLIGVSIFWGICVQMVYDDIQNQETLQSVGI